MLNVSIHTILVLFSSLSPSLYLFLVCNFCGCIFFFIFLFPFRFNIFNQSGISIYDIIKCQQLPTNLSLILNSCSMFMIVQTLENRVEEIHPDKQNFTVKSDSSKKRKCIGRSNNKNTTLYGNKKFFFRSPVVAIFHSVRFTHSLFSPLSPFYPIFIIIMVECGNQYYHYYYFSIFIQLGWQISSNFRNISSLKNDTRELCTRAHIPSFLENS